MADRYRVTEANGAPITSLDRLREAGIRLGDEAHARLAAPSPLPALPPFETPGPPPLPGSTLFARLVQPAFAADLAAWLLETADEYDQIDASYPSYHADNPYTYARALAVADHLLAPAAAAAAAAPAEDPPPVPLPTTQPLQMLSYLFPDASSSAPSPTPSPSDPDPPLTAPYVTPLTDPFPTSPSPPSSPGLS